MADITETKTEQVETNKEDSGTKTNVELGADKIGDFMTLVKNLSGKDTEQDKDNNKKRDKDSKEENDGLAYILLSLIPSYWMLLSMFVVFCIILIVGISEGENVTKPLAWMLIICSFYIIAGSLLKQSK